MVAAGWVDGDAGGLVDDDDIVIFEDYFDGFVGDGGFVAVGVVRNVVAVVDDCGVRGSVFGVDEDLACFDCFRLSKGQLQPLDGEKVRT